MKIRFDYSERLKSMTIELVAESNLDEDTVEILWRDRFAVSSLHRSANKTSVILSKRADTPDKKEE